jgi:hypothetical protein
VDLKTENFAVKLSWNARPAKECELKPPFGFFTVGQNLKRDDAI